MYDVADALGKIRELKSYNWWNILLADVENYLEHKLEEVRNG